MSNASATNESAFSKLSNYISSLNSDFELAIKSGGHLALCNSGIRGGVKEFNLGIPEIIEILEDILRHNASFASAAHYDEKTWRDLGGQNFSNRTASSLVTVQTKPVFTTLSKLIHWANKNAPDDYRDGIIDLSKEAIENTISKLQEVKQECAPNAARVKKTQPLPLESLLNDKKTFLSRLYHSLLTKPLTILTGASGTGKTKLAISLAKYLGNTENSNSSVVAVGADWTDNRNVLGFVNHLNTAPDDRPYYQSTPILDLLLRAKDDGEVPYFLILDEMNLSHVERYFSDFLSVMEQDEGFLKLHNENENLPRSGQTKAEVPPALKYPDNLFVIGTVNIDETTYMFSPKVLDRANVIEFTVSDTEIESFLKNPQPYEDPEPAAPGVAEGFLALAKQARSMNCEALPAKTHEEIASHLLNLFRILKAGRFEFAYRSAKEITIYLQVSRHLANDKDAWDGGGWQRDLDDQILQKLLPKLHGSVGRVGSLLATLAEYCQSGTYKEGTKPSLNAALDLQGEESAAFPGSLAKLKAMIRTLQDEQFVSFIQ